MRRTRWITLLGAQGRRQRVRLASGPNGESESPNLGMRYLVCFVADTQLLIFIGQSDAVRSIFVDAGELARAGLHHHGL